MLGMSCDCCGKPPDPGLTIEINGIYRSCSALTCGVKGLPIVWGKLDADCSEFYDPLDKCIVYKQVKTNLTHHNYGQSTETGLYRIKNYELTEGNCVITETCGGSRTKTDSRSGCCAGGGGDSMPGSGSLSFVETEQASFTGDCELKTITQSTSGSSHSGPWINTNTYWSQTDCTCNVSITYGSDVPYSASGGCTFTENRKTLSGIPLAPITRETGPVSGVACCASSCSQTITWSPSQVCSAGPDGVEYILDDTTGSSCSSPNCFIREEGLVQAPECEYPEDAGVPDLFGRDKENSNELPPLEPGQTRTPAPDHAYKFVGAGAQLKTELYSKWRVTHHPSATCYLKVWFAEREQKYKLKDCDDWEEDGDPVYRKLNNTYVWEKSGNPCFNHNDKPPQSYKNLIKGEESYDLNPDDVEPGKGVSRRIAILKYSLVKGFEPEDPSFEYVFNINAYDESNRCQNDSFPRPCCPNCDD